MILVLSSFLKNIFFLGSILFIEMGVVSMFTNIKSLTTGDNSGVLEIQRITLLPKHAVMIFLFEFSTL